MATPDSRFVAMFPLQEYFVDKTTGAPLSAGVITFYEDTNRTVFKDVYQQSQSPSGDYIFTNLGHTITLTSVGTPGDESGNDIIPFLFPYDGTPDDSQGTVQLYYITVYATEDGVPTVFQFSREAWPPQQFDTSSNAEGLVQSGNILTNPQFSVVSFIPDPTTGSYIYSVTGTDTETPLAPGWILQTTGTGTVTVIQVPETDTTVPTNPPYVLDLQGSSGVTSWRIVQRLQASPRLLTNGFAAGYFIARTASGSAGYELELLYIPSNASATNRIIVSGSTTADNNWGVFTGSIDIPGTGGTVNSDDAPTGYVDIALDIPSGAHIQVSSFQVVGIDQLLESTSTSFPTFFQQSTQEQLNGLMWYYEPQLRFKPIPSYTIGWDFAYNPCQELGTTVAAASNGANTSRYIADQTILFTSVNNSIAANFTSPEGITLTTTASSSFALIQYLDATNCYDLLRNKIAVELGAYSEAGIDFEINMYWTQDSSLPTISSPTYQSLVSAVSAEGVPTISNGTWNLIPRPIGVVKDVINPPTTVEASVYSYNGWDATAEANISSAKFFAIVVSFATLVNPNNVVIGYISVCSGDMATKPAASNKAEVLAALEYYYEKSYALATLPGTASTISNQMCYPMSSVNYTTNTGPVTYNWYASAANFTIPLKTVKRTPSYTPVLYAPVSGSSGNVTFQYYSPNAQTPTDLAASTWSLVPGTNAINGTLNSTTNLQSVTGITTATPAYSSSIALHYVVDARFGVV